MSEAIAAVKISLPVLREKLGAVDPAAAGASAGRETLRAQNGAPIGVRGVGDATLVFTGASLRETEPDELGWVMRQLLGDLLDLHDDTRGILVFPDMVRPKAKSWSELVDEIAELGEWVPKVDASFVPERFQTAPSGSLEAAMGQMMNALGPDLGQLQRSLMGGDPAAMQDAAQRMQALLASPEGKPLMDMLQQLDVGQMLEQARAAGIEIPNDENDEDDDNDDDDDGGGAPAKRE